MTSRTLITLTLFAAATIALAAAHGRARYDSPEHAYHCQQVAVWTSAESAGIDRDDRPGWPDYDGRCARGGGR